MRALALLASALVLAGCAVPAGVPEPRAAGSDGPLGVQIGMPPHGFQAPPPPEAVEKPAADPEAPPVTLGGTASHAVAVLVKETTLLRESRFRTPCGGAIVATAPGAADPRPRFDQARYVASYELLDAEAGRWVTDLYLLDDEGNATSVWVSNVGGGERWRADDGKESCPASTNGTKEYNVLLHARGVERVALYFSPAGRPAGPEARSWAGPE